MTILVAVKKNGRVFLGADRMTTFGNSQYFTNLVNGSKITQLKNAYLAKSGYTLLDNILEHLHVTNHKIIDNPFLTRTDVFQFFLELYGELKKQYTHVEKSKETYAGIYNTYLIATGTSIFGVSNNLTVTEFPAYAAKGAGAAYSLGCLYALYETVGNGEELCRMALEAACHFNIHCKEPLEIIEVKDLGKPVNAYKDHGKALITVPGLKGTGKLIEETSPAAEREAEKTRKKRN